MTARDRWEKARRRMIEVHLKGRDIRDESVLEVMKRTPRERFLSPSDASRAYADGALQIECGQTISQPYIVALMTQSLELSGTERVLEIGTGSGYQTAVLAQLAKEVIGIERHEKLALLAQERLRECGLSNVEILVGDGARGHPEKAPYDRIIITAAAPDCPSALYDQLAMGGILVGPFGSVQSQILQRIRKRPDRRDVEDLTPCRFVPLVEEEKSD